MAHEEFPGGLGLPPADGPPSDAARPFRRRLARWAIWILTPVVAVAAALALRLALTAWVGPGLATYITFYPAVMAVALLAGFWPGLVATALTGVVMAWYLPPEGTFGIAAPVDRLGLVIFGIMGLFMSVVAELYRRDRHKAAAYDRETALRASESFYRQTLESIPGMVFTTRPDGFCDYQSQQWVEFTGVPVSEHVGDGWNKLLHPDDRPRAFAAWQAAVTGRAPYDLEYRVKGRDGRYEWFKVIGQPIRNAAGEVVRWFGVALNIDNLKRAEESLRFTAEELARSNKNLEAFAYLASHDLQAPLRQVASFVTLLGVRYKGRLDADADDYIDFAAKGAAQMSELINDLLAYSKVGNKDTKLQSINLREPLDRALSLLSGAIAESGAKVAIAELPTVQAHAGQLTQVFQNLIGNAVKFRAAPPLEIEISARREGGEWLLCVKDNGIGMDPQHSHQAFELFRRLHDREKYPGTGIGLAICKKIVERHGGRIWVESQPGEGCTFCFTLPTDRGA